MWIKCSLLACFIVTIHSATDLLRSTDLFAGKLYDALNTSNENVVCSPLSVHTLLALVYQASVGRTEASLRSSLRLPGKEETAVQYRDVLSDLNRKTDITIEVANKIYVKNDRRLKDSFKAVARQYFLAEADSLDFNDTRGAADEINNWVGQKTNGKIHQLVSASDFDRYTRSVLLNAVYFKAKWAAKFDAENTRSAPFYVSPGRTVNCPMMYRSADFHYGENRDLDAKLLKLKFRDERFSLLVVLPNSRTGIEQLETRIAKVPDLSVLRKSLWGTRAEVYLPRFKIESTFQLKGALAQLGLGQIFEDDADFPNMLEGGETLTVSKVIHKATIEINEKGGEASAATAVIVAVPVSASYEPPPPVLFKADHPFLFFLTVDVGPSDYGYYRDDVILFTGRVTTPEILG